MKQPAQVLVIIALALVGHVATAADLYVSPEGNDAWTGTLEKPNRTLTDGPLASLVGARNAIRKLRAAGTLQQPIRVRIQGGRYALREPLVFEPRELRPESKNANFASSGPLLPCCFSVSRLTSTLNAPLVPARQAYSHSASVGRR